MCRECNGYENEFSIENGILTIHKAYNNKSGQLRLEIAKTKPRSKYKYEVGSRIRNEKLDITILDRVFGRPYGSEYYNSKHYVIACNKCGCVTYKNENNITIRGCGVCGSHLEVVYTGYNDIATTHPHIAKQWHPTKNGSLLPTMVSSGSKKKVWWLCDECGHDDWKSEINTRTRYNTGCPNCGKGTSYPEKVVALVLKALGIKFKREHRFDGYSYKYDFYLIDYDIIIEVHGMQHYWYLDVKTMYKRMSVRGRNGIEEHENDVNKQDLAESKGYVYSVNYCVLDARYSNIDYIRNSIEQCLFFQQFDLDNIDWQEIDKQTQTSQKIDICKYWKEGKEVNKDLATTDLAKEFGVDRRIIRVYLKWGSENGLCEYDGEEESQANNKRRSKEVYLVKSNGEKWFDESMSLNKLARQSGISQSTISKCMRNDEPLKRDNRAKYDPKYIGSYVMSVEDYNLKYGSN